MNTLLFLLLCGFTVLGVMVMRGSHRGPLAVLRDSARLLVSALGLAYLLLTSLVGSRASAPPEPVA